MFLVASLPNSANMFQLCPRNFWCPRSKCPPLHHLWPFSTAWRSPLGIEYSQTTWDISKAGAYLLNKSMAWNKSHDSHWNLMYSGRVDSLNQRMSEFIQQQHQSCHWRDVASNLLKSYCIIPRYLQTRQADICGEGWCPGRIPVAKPGAVAGGTMGHQNWLRKTWKTTVPMILDV